MLVDLDPTLLGTESDCLGALTRRYASTNVCMTMDYPSDEQVVDLVHDFIHVSPERKTALVEEWQTGTMGNGDRFIAAEVVAFVTGKKNTSVFCSQYYRRFFREVWPI